MSSSYDNNPLVVQIDDRHYRVLSSDGWAEWAVDQDPVGYWRGSNKDGFFFVDRETSNPDSVIGDILNLMSYADPH